VILLLENLITEEFFFISFNRTIIA